MPDRVYLLLIKGERRKGLCWGIVYWVRRALSGVSVVCLYLG